MRLFLTSLCLTLAASGAHAQSDDFNPYQAVLAAMPLSEAQPLIAAAYGSAEETTANIPEDFAGEGVKMLSSRTDGSTTSLFLFCDDRLAAVSAVVTAKVAAEILMPFLTPDGPKLKVYPGEQGVMISTEEPDIQIGYWGVGTKASYVSVGYPGDVFKDMSFRQRCREVGVD